MEPEEKAVVVWTQEACEVAWPNPSCGVVSGFEGGKEERRTR